MIDKLHDFIAMGGYGAYVWSSYAIMLAVFAGLWWYARHSRMRALRRIAAAAGEGDAGASSSAS